MFLITGMQISPQLLAIMTAFELREEEGYPSNITQPSPNQRMLKGSDDYIRTEGYTRPLVSPGLSAIQMPLLFMGDDVNITFGIIFIWVIFKKQNKTGPG